MNALFGYDLVIPVGGQQGVDVCKEFIVGLVTKKTILIFKKINKSHKIILNQSENAKKKNTNKKDQRNNA